MQWCSVRPVLVQLIDVAKPDISQGSIYMVSTYHGLKLALKLMHLVLRLTKHISHLLFVFSKPVCIAVFKVLEFRGMNIIGTIEVILQFFVFIFEALLLS